MTWEGVNSEERRLGLMSATNLWGEEVRHFFQAEQDAADGSSKRHCDACSTCCAEYLASLAYVMVRSETKSVNITDNTPSLFSYLAK